MLFVCALWHRTISLSDPYQWLLVGRHHVCAFQNRYIELLKNTCFTIHDSYDLIKLRQKTHMDIVAWLKTGNEQWCTMVKYMTWLPPYTCLQLLGFCHLNINTCCFGALLFMTILVLFLGRTFSTNVNHIKVYKQCLRQYPGSNYNWETWLKV